MHIINYLLSYSEISYDDLTIIEENLRDAQK